MEVMSDDGKSSADATYEFILSIIDLPLPIHHVFKSVNRLNDRHSRGCL